MRERDIERHLVARVKALIWAIGVVGTIVVVLIGLWLKGF